MLMPEKSPPWPSSFSRTDVSQPNTGLVPRGVPESPIPEVAPPPLTLMLSAAFTCVRCGIITNTLSKKFCGVDFAPSLSLWSIVQVLLLPGCIATSAVPDKHFLCLP